MKYIKVVDGEAVTKTKAPSLNAPTGASTDGVDISRFAKISGQGWPLAMLAITGDGAGSLAAGAALWGFNPTVNLWGFIANLNNGSAITLSATQAFYQEIDTITAFTKLAVVGTVNGGINVGYQVIPLAEIY